MTPAERKAACDTFLHGNRPRTAHAVLRELAEHAEAAGLDADVYGQGEAIAGLEGRVAELLGKPAAVFVPSGTMAQQIALRIWADRAGRSHVGLHPTSHLDRDEQRGYAVLHGLHGTLLGTEAVQMGPDDVSRCAQPLAAVVLELPARRLGGTLLPLEDVHAIAATCHARGTRLHLDGARLWEAAAGYGCPPEDVCAPFDSVYVSVYKGLGGPAGALLAGPADLVAEARPWIRRHGGNLPTLHPFVVGAHLGLERELPRMPEFLTAARRLVGANTGLPGLRWVPGTPQVNLVHLHLEAPLPRVLAARDDVADRERVWLFGGGWVTATGCATEIYVGDAAMAADPARIDRALRTLSGLLRGHSQ